MIRARIPIVDDNKLYHMVRLQLIPLAQIYRPALRISRKEIVERLQRNKIFVTAEGKDQPFGFISAKITDTELWIDMLAVDKQYRKHGWGSALMAAAENYGKRKGCKSSNLFVDEHNKHAQNFYLRKGYYLKNYHGDIYCYLFVKDL